MSTVDSIMNLVRNMAPDAEILAAVKEVDLQLKERKASYLVACEQIEDLELIAKERGLRIERSEGYYEERIRTKDERIKLLDDSVVVLRRLLVSAEGNLARISVGTSCAFSKRIADEAIKEIHS